MKKKDYIYIAAVLIGFSLSDVIWKKFQERKKQKEPTRTVEEVTQELFNSIFEEQNKGFQQILKKYSGE